MESYEGAWQAAASMKAGNSPASISASLMVKCFTALNGFRKVRRRMISRVAQDSRKRR